GFLDSSPLFSIFGFSFLLVSKSKWQTAVFFGKIIVLKTGDCKHRICVAGDTQIRLSEQFPETQKSRNRSAGFEKIIFKIRVFPVFP
ncbi:MAG: hypothetical protein ABS987_12410, partial [Ruminococcus sp.]